MDSSFIHASVHFIPPGKNYYQTFVAIMAKKKDTINIQKAFEEAIQYRKEPYVWNLYFRFTKCTGKGSQSFNPQTVPYSYFPGIQICC